jgi:hypothetical protein
MSLPRTSKGQLLRKTHDAVKNSVGDQQTMNATLRLRAALELA